MLLGQDNELAIQAQKAEEKEQIEIDNDQPEEAIVSMHATYDHPLTNTMRFKREIGNQSVFTLIDSDSAHSFVNHHVLQQPSVQIVQTSLIVAMVANGARMVTDSICQGL
jgi:hypothetical protein